MPISATSRRCGSSTKSSKDRFWQAALTVQGKIANFFDVTYAGAYMDRPRSSSSDYTDYTDAYNQYYIDYYNNYVDAYGYAPSFCSGPEYLAVRHGGTTTATSSIHASTS